METAIWYTICVIIVVARLFSQKLVNGSFKCLRLDDWIMIPTFLMYTGVIITIDLFDHLLPRAYLDTGTPDDIKYTIIENKVAFGNEILMLAAIWGVKTCLLLLYARLTAGFVENKITKIVGVYVALCFVTLLILFVFVFCWPTSQYWSVVQTNEQCGTYRNYFIVHTILNTSSDIMILCIPVSFLRKSGLSGIDKLLVGGVFSLGGFVIFAAILTKYYSFVEPYSQHWEFWYLRESSTAILTGNLPLCLPAMRKVARFVKPILPKRLRDAIPQKTNRAESKRMRDFGTNIEGNEPNSSSQPSHCRDKAVNTHCDGDWSETFITKFPEC